MWVGKQFVFKIHANPPLHSADMTLLLDGAARAGDRSKKTLPVLVTAVWLDQGGIQRGGWWSSQDENGKTKPSRR